jgi:hypothetical protein
MAILKPDGRHRNSLERHLWNADWLAPVFGIGTPHFESGQKQL